MYSSLVSGMYNFTPLGATMLCIFHNCKDIYITLQYQVLFFCHELRVYYQLPVVGCVSLTSLSIACAWPFGWSCALKTIAPILSVTIIFIILPMLLCLYNSHHSLQMRYQKMRSACACIKNSLTKVCAQNNSE